MQKILKCGSIYLMALKICSIASSSKGNCIFVGSEKTRLLIDVGISFIRVKKSLLVLGEYDTQTPKPLNVLVTHTHRDHISGIDLVVKNLGATVYSYEKSRLGFRIKSPYKTFALQPFMVGDIQVQPIAAPHDTPCVGFKLKNGTSVISILTDVGELSEPIIETLSESDIVFLESNHDIDMLRRGPYDISLKRRVLSSEGHLSNDTAAAALEKIVARGRAKQIILGHLSENNNTPELAERTVLKRLINSGAVQNKDFYLEVAPAAGLSGLYSVE